MNVELEASDYTFPDDLARARQNGEDLAETLFQELKRTLSSPPAPEYGTSVKTLFTQVASMPSYTTGHFNEEKSASLKNNEYRALLFLYAEGLFMSSRFFALCRADGIEQKFPDALDDRMCLSLQDGVDDMSFLLDMCLLPGESAEDCRKALSAITLPAPAKAASQASPSPVVA